MRCNICGGNQFGPGPAGRLTANQLPPYCRGCGSLERQRMIRRVLQAMPLGFFDRRRSLLLGGDMLLEKRWFKSLQHFDLAAINAGRLQAQASNSFDAIFVYQVLENIADDRQFLRDALHKLSPRGILVIHLAGMKTRAKSSEVSEPPGTFHQYGADAVQHLARALNGLHVLSIDEADPCTGVRDTLLLCCKFEGEARQSQDWLQKAGPGSSVKTELQWVQYPPPVDEAVFAPLHAELALWQEAGRACTFWWRDDDLIQYSPLLQQLNDLADEFQTKVLTAIIPGQADDKLAEQTRALSALVFCQHGYQHQSHEEKGQLSNEFGPARTLQAIEEDLRQGWQRLHTMFGDNFFPIFVPPWNRIVEPAQRLLPALGFRGLSQYQDQERHLVPGLQLVNTHIDILQWATVPQVQCYPPPVLVARLVDLLMRRRRQQGEDEPLGVLTHHRVMRDDSWIFMHHLLQTTRKYSCVRWLTPQQVFPQVA